MEPIIKLTGIAAGYEGKTVLSGVNLTVYDHDFLGVIGPNGGGKTTLMRVLLRLLKPGEGRVEYFKEGRPVKELTMGYLPQYSNIDRKFPISVYEVVLSGLCRQKKFLGRYTPEQHLQVKNTIRKMEIEQIARRPIGTLSGGQLQRVLLARAIVSVPDVLVLDEPNTYIDKHFQAQMYEMLKQLNRDCAIVIVSHDVATVLENATHIACVNRTLHYHDSAHIPMEDIEHHFRNI